MSEWLVIWGVAQGVGILVKPILEELAVDGAKDLVKDFFKDSDFLKKNRSSTINEFFSIYTGNFSQILYAEI